MMIDLGLEEHLITRSLKERRPQPVHSVEGNPLNGFTVQRQLTGKETSDRLIPHLSSHGARSQL